MEHRSDGDNGGLTLRTRQAPALARHNTFKFPTTVRLIVNGTLLMGVFAVVGDTMTTMRVVRMGRPMTSLEKKVLMNGVTTASILFWPVLWDSTVGYSTIIERPRVAFGFFWPMVISAFDLHYTLDKRGLQSGELTGLSRGLNLDAQAIISAAFAMGALMSGLKSVRGTHIIMYALIMSLALVIPQVATPSHSTDRAVMLSGQKAALNYAIGYIVAGIGVDFMSGATNKAIYNRMRL